MNEEENDIFKFLVEFSLLRDVKGPAYFCTDLIDECILLGYFGLREENSKLSSEALSKFRPFFRNLADSICKKRAEIHWYSAEDILVLKSAIAFISEDFPELSDSMNYAPLIFQLNGIIDSWHNNIEQQFENFESFDRADFHRESVPENHVWWKILNNVKCINGVAIEAARAEQVIKYDARNPQVICALAMEEYRRAVEECKLAKDRKTSAMKTLFEKKFEFSTACQKFLNTANAKYRQARFASIEAQNQYDIAKGQFKLSVDNMQKKSNSAKEAKAELERLTNILRAAINLPFF